MKNGSKIFIDTAPFIYLLEDNPLYSQQVRKYISDCFMAEYDFYTSLLTVAEYCVVPYRLNCQEKIEYFEQFILDVNIQLIELTKEIAQLSSQIRAKYSAIKMIDALQIATAITENCSAFLTNDKQLQQIQEINCILIENLKG